MIASWSHPTLDKLMVGPSCLVLSLLNRDGSILNNNEINVVDVLVCYEGIIEIRSKQVTLEFWVHLVIYDKSGCELVAHTYYVVDD